MIGLILGLVLSRPPARLTVQPATHHGPDQANVSHFIFA
jgi:hypothetical protein